VIEPTEEGLKLFLVAIVAVAVGAVAILVIRHLAKLDAQRRAAYAALAAKYGLRYRSGLGSPADHILLLFSCFEQGHSRRANHLLDGRVRTAEGHEIDLLAGEWRFLVTTSNGKSTTTTEYVFGFVVIGHGAGPCPGLQVRKENLFDRLAGAIGWDDIDFESVEFSKKFHVKSPDKRFAYDLLDPRMIELFLVADSIPQVDLVHGHFCLHYGRSSRLEPPMLDLLMQWGTLFVDRIPRVVRAGLAEGRYGR
jgi:hypothetical protein